MFHIINTKNLNNFVGTGSSRSTTTTATIPTTTLHLHILVPTHSERFFHKMGPESSPRPLESTTRRKILRPIAWKQPKYPKHPPEAQK